MRAILTGLNRRHLALIGAVVLGLNLLGWGMLWGLRNVDVAVLGIGALAYAFGLRHAFDADHIAAIDNVTRKLRQEGKMPVAVGFFFSLGHSTVVFLLSFVLVFIVREAGESLWFKEWGGVFSTVVGAGFLIFRQLLSTYRGYRKQQAIGETPEMRLDELLDKRGFFNRIFRGMNRHIDESWKMFWVGFLFGFGFDTATEIAVLGISATAAQSGVLPLWGVMVFPLLFAAGMTLLDSIDGILMLKAYDWAMADALRKLFFNLTITGLSVVIALGIGTIEWMQLLSDRLGWDGGIWESIRDLDFGQLGIGVVVLMLGAWGIAWVYYRRALRHVGSAG